MGKLTKQQLHTIREQYKHMRMGPTSIVLELLFQHIDAIEQEFQTYTITKRLS